MYLLRQRLRGRAWQNRKHSGTLLAMAISTPDKTGNGIQLFDTKTGSLRVLDSGTSTYSNFAWRKESSDLAALKSKSDDKKDGPDLHRPHLEKSRRSRGIRTHYDPTATDQKFPAGLRTVSYRRPTWSGRSLHYTLRRALRLVFETAIASRGGKTRRARRRRGR